MGVSDGGNVQKARQCPGQFTASGVKVGSIQFALSLPSPFTGKTETHEVESTTLLHVTNRVAGVGADPQAPHAPGHASRNSSSVQLTIEQPSGSATPKHPRVGAVVGEDEEGGTEGSPVGAVVGVVVQCRVRQCPGHAVANEEVVQFACSLPLTSVGKSTSHEESSTTPLQINSFDVGGVGGHAWQVAGQSC